MKSFLFFLLPYTRQKENKCVSIIQTANLFYSSGITLWKLFFQESTSPIQGSHALSEQGLCFILLSTSRNILHKATLAHSNYWRWMNWILTIFHAFPNGPLPLLCPNGVKTDPSQWGKVAREKAASGWHGALLKGSEAKSVPLLKTLIWV